MSDETPSQETLEHEFKSDRQRLGDRELVEAVVCLANSSGGSLWLGIENDGTITGFNPERRHIQGLMGVVASKTSPPLNVSVRIVEAANKQIIRIIVPRSIGPVSTNAGVYLVCRIRYDDTPECVPLLSHDLSRRASQLGAFDASAQEVEVSTLADLDPLERNRLRQTISRYGGDRILLELDDEGFDGALGITTTTPQSGRLPTLTGLLLIGKEESLKRLLPSHELAFQVLSREAISVNEFRSWPLVKLLEWVEVSFKPHNPESELQVGLFRVPIPRVDPAAFREAIGNAVVHRNYLQQGAIHVRLDDQGLTISNPGGLVDGVTIANLLTTEPRPRNRSLADALKRLGVVERSGRGVDTIYRGMLRFGRTTPNYRGTTSESVVLVLPTIDADPAFVRLVVEEEGRRGAPLDFESLIILAALRTLKRQTAEELANHVQRDPVQVKRALEGLVENGLVQTHGSTPRTRSYTLAASIYHALGGKAAYIRQAGFSAIQHEQMVLSYVRKHGRIRRADVIDLCRLTSEQAKLLLAHLKQAGLLTQVGERRTAHYTLPEGQ